MESIIGNFPFYFLKYLKGKKTHTRENELLPNTKSAYSCIILSLFYYNYDDEFNVFKWRDIDKWMKRKVFFSSKIFLKYIK